VPYVLDVILFVRHILYINKSKLAPSTSQTPNTASFRICNHGLEESSDPEDYIPGGNMHAPTYQFRSMVDKIVAQDRCLS